MTKAFKIGIGNLLFEFLAHTLVFLCTLNSARAVTACPLQALFNCLYCFFVGIKCYFHLLTPQFLRRLPLISSLDYTIYRKPKIVKHASASLSVRQSFWFCNQNEQTHNLFFSKNYNVKLKLAFIQFVLAHELIGERCSPIRYNGKFPTFLYRYLRVFMGSPTEF